MLDEGHWTNWLTIVDDYARIEPLVTAIVERGRQVGPHPPRLPDGSELYTIASPETPLCVLILIKSTADANAPREIFSSYPFATKGVCHRLIVDEIIPWPDGGEAWIKAGLASFDGSELTFFDPRFYMDRTRLQVGTEADFILAGLAYTAQVAHPEPVLITDPDKIRAMRGRDRADDLSPIEIRGEGGTILLPDSKLEPDGYQFQGPVKDITAFEVFGRNISRIRITMTRELEPVTDIDIDLYVAERAWQSAERPQSGSDLQGLMWLQGYLA